MAESTLTLTRLQLKTAVGQYLSLSRTIADWSAENASDVDLILASGLRNFYSPHIKSKNPSAPHHTHVWSFLIGRTSVSLSNGTATYDLADDFGGFVDTELAFTSSKDWPLLLVPMWRVLEKIQSGTSMPSGITQPLLAAVERKSFTAATGQRWQIVVWPTPTSSLTATGRYRSEPDLFANDAHYPMGNALHAETIQESCLAAAEELMNDQSAVHRERFVVLLEASIAADRELHKSEAVISAA